MLESELFYEEMNLFSTRSVIHKLILVSRISLDGQAFRFRIEIQTF